MSKTLPWQKYNLKMEFDGYEVEAIITYWAKDYYIDIIKPCQKRISGEHMLYMIPAKFVIDDKKFTNKSAGHNIPILQKCKDKITKFLFNEWS